MARKKWRFRFSIRMKLALLTLTVAIITYTTSAFFIFVVHPYLFGDRLPMVVSIIIVLSEGILWSGILAFVSAPILTNRIRRLEEATKKVAAGDMRQKVEPGKADDEIRALGIAFNQLVDNFCAIIRSIEENFRKTSEQVKIISEKSMEASEQADGIASTVEEIARGAEQTAVLVQETAEALGKLTAIAENVQENAKNSETIAAEMMNKIGDSKEILSSLIRGIENVAMGSSHSLAAVNRLQENAREIEQIIQMVGDIATQTNLLALNASIEAARAGEYGLGFAVVADEIRKLADESARAVESIAKLIGNMQNDVATVVEQITEQVDTVNEEANKVTTANESLDAVTRVVNQMFTSVQTISQLIDEQLEMIKNTALQSQEVSAIAEETSAATEEVSASTTEQQHSIDQVEKLIQELQKDAEALNNTISHFKLQAS